MFPSRIGLSSSVSTPKPEIVVGTAKPSVGTAMTFDMPSSRPDGNLYVAFALCHSHPSFGEVHWSTPPAGWTEITGAQASAYDPPSSTWYDARMIAKIGSSEPATYTWQFTTSGYAAVQVVGFSNTKSTVISAVTLPSNALGATGEPGIPQGLACQSGHLLYLGLALNTTSGGGTLSPSGYTPYGYVNSPGSPLGKLISNSSKVHTGGLIPGALYGTNYGTYWSVSRIAIAGR